MKNKILLSLFLLTVSFNFCSAQNTKNDSIKNEKLKIVQNNDFSDKQKDYLKDFVYEKSEKNIDRALDLLQLIVALVAIIFTIFSFIFLIVGFLGLKEFRDIVKQKKLMGESLVEVNKLKDELTNLEEKVDTTAKNRNLVDKVHFLWQLGLFKDAIKLTEEVEKTVNDKDLLYRNFKNRALIYMDIKNMYSNFDRAYSSLRQAFEIKQDDLDIYDLAAYCKIILANAENNFANKKKHLEKAEEHFGSLKELLSDEDIFNNKRFVSNLGFLEIEKNNYVKAIEHFQVSKRITNKYPEIDFSNDLGISFCQWKFSTSEDSEIQFKNFQKALKIHPLWSNYSEKILRYFHLKDEEIIKLNEK